jgi:hypothetical protein
MDTGFPPAAMNFPAKTIPNDPEVISGNRSTKPRRRTAAMTPEAGQSM